MSIARHRSAIGLLALLAAVPAAAQSGEDLRVPVPGTGSSLAARLCRPPGERPARLVVINHGSPVDADQRRAMDLHRCDDEAARWFLERGNAVVFALRRGYGATAGEWAETFGGCGRGDFDKAGLETARDIDAVVEGVTALPGIRRDGVVVVGQSAGAWGTLAYDSRPHAKVSAFVAVAAGRGGHKDGLANHNCAPDRLVAAAGLFGATASTPMIWIYAVNDSFFGPDLAARLHRSFTGAGGRAELVQPAAFGRDGHGLFFGRGGSAVWGPPVAAYLSRQLRD